MISSAWDLADLNIQHRVMNAIIKEEIFPEGLMFSEHNNQVNLQYKGRALVLDVERKSIMQRYVFNGKPTYKCGNTQYSINDLEQLINILTYEFDINIQERLKEELLSSRDGFEITYQNFENREKHIHSSLRFTRMPEIINFFAWLQHITEESDLNDLSYSESLVLEGHPTHPLSKTKLPLTQDEMKKYAPEFEKVIPLKLMLIHKNKAVPTTMEGDEQFILDSVLPEYKYRLKAFLEPYNLKLKDYQLILVHPWQYDNVIVNEFKSWIKDQYLLPTPFEIPSKATLSFRTMELINKPFHIKLPVSIQMTSAIRTVGPVTTIDGPRLSYELQSMLDIYPQLQVATEPYGIYADTEESLAKQLACIVRRKPIFVRNGVTIVTASLVNKNPIDNKYIVDSYLEWIDNGVDKKTIQKFIFHYADTLIKPLIAYIQDYGIALEAHMQNTVVNLGYDYQMAFIVRDLGGSRIDLNTMHERLPNVEINNKSLIGESIEAVIEKFQHAVIQNQIAELIHHFNQYDDVDEQGLFKIVQSIVDDAIDDNKRHATELRKILFGETITVKALLRMRMEDKVKKYVTTELTNPLRREV
ncbi:IucA/IucC family protein [Staphylococcus kloosii]|uniref:Siderophore synthetase n=1 Tax=Staphylococcus kloosii TaxID=29384 RepID=A0A151A1F2_9STAP|nr:IucA/IucC family protein [Staphylococcus kloosii]KYH13209.1 siderophore synthetase [Staphylococcus kloosii]MCD8880026.1 siderophore synthetase [Staphylococcus kloosii]